MSARSAVACGGFARRDRQTAVGYLAASTAILEARDRHADERGREIAVRHHDEHEARMRGDGDRKSTRLNSSHLVISYAVFCLKKKKKKNTQTRRSSQRCNYTV